MRRFKVKPGQGWSDVLEIEDNVKILKGEYTNIEKIIGIESDTIYDTLEEKWILEEGKTYIHFCSSSNSWDYYLARQNWLKIPEKIRDEIKHHYQIRDIRKLCELCSVNTVAELIEKYQFHISTFKDLGGRYAKEFYAIKGLTGMEAYWLKDLTEI